MAEDVVEAPEGQDPQPAAAPAPTPVPAPDHSQQLLQALAEARESNKRMGRDLDEYRQRVEKSEQRVQQILSAANQRPAPDIQTDPLGHFQHRNQVLEEELKGVNSKLDQFAQASAHQDEQARLRGAVMGYEQEFKGSAPDYDQAVNYLRHMRAEELRDLGADPLQVAAILEQETVGLAKAAISQGKNPAKIAYEMAKRRGYKAQANGSAPGPIETIAKGLEASKTVDGSGKAALTAAGMLNLPDKEFDAIIKDEAKWQAFIRGQTIQ